MLVCLRKRYAMPRTKEAILQGSLKRESIDEATLTRLKALNKIAEERGQSLARRIELC